MKQVLEFIPLIIFFIVYKTADIYAATAALMIGMTITFIYSYFKNGKKAEKMQIITLGMILIFGTFTLVLHNDAFLKWKVTLVYAVFAIGLLATQYIFKKPAIKQMLGKELDLPDSIWNNLNLAWALFFIVLGVVNTYIAFNLSQEVWVNFKVFGLLAVTIIFTVLSGLYLYKHLPEEGQKKIVDDKKSGE
ncbi:septation protein A [Psychromonas sp. psych-6C06]|uniref:septation protein A n=1 Tax=Psychromonas sp. psych-6C06 TaxID=2058089 RepID=UPI000C330053|nr:septation protein A [Psychromonas sp. psych-6C06]PKF62624.1 septation protein A [Psychromonas sp. psych-6C06]